MCCLACVGPVVWYPVVAVFAPRHPEDVGDVHRVGTAAVAGFRHSHSSPSGVTTRWIPAAVANLRHPAHISRVT